MSDLPLLYVADADEAFRRSAEQILGTDFSVRTFADSLACIALLSEQHPAILLLSSNLADTCAIELCRDLRADGLADDTHIILLLESDAPTERLEAAHAAGSDEAITQPVNLADLRRQLRTTYRLASERSSFRQQANYAQQVAMTAMSSMGELGVVLQFLSRCFNCKTEQEVAQEVIAALAQYGLSGAVQVRGDQAPLLECTPDSNPAEDGAVIERLRSIGRIFEFKTRMAINYDHASILMNNVPDDNEQRGRIRDNVAMLAEGAHARIASLLIEQDNRRKQEGIRFALAETLSMTNDLREQQHSSQVKGQEAVNATIESFESAFIRFSLPPEQESELISLLFDLKQEVGSLGMMADEIDGKLQLVVRSLQSIAEEKL